MTNEQVTNDYKALWTGQQERLVALARALGDRQWDEASLCEGWQVRHVMAHMTYGFTTSLPKLLAKVAAYRGDVARASFDVSRELGDRLGRIELIELYERERRSPKGISRVLEARDGSADNVVHALDMRRALGFPPVQPFSTEARVAALDALCQVRTRIFAPAKVARGLTLVATDVEWRGGEGPTVAGATEDLALALAGRPAGLAGLRGDGVAELTTRIGAAA